MAIGPLPCIGGFADKGRCVFGNKRPVDNEGYLEIFSWLRSCFVVILRKALVVPLSLPPPPFLSCYRIVLQPPAEPGSLHFCAHTFSRVCVVSFVQSPYYSVPACASCLSEGGEKEMSSGEFFCVSSGVRTFIIIPSFTNELLPFRYITPPKPGEWINVQRREGMHVPLPHASKIGVGSWMGILEQWSIWQRTAYWASLVECYKMPPDILLIWCISRCFLWYTFFKEDPTAVGSLSQLGGRW